MPRRMCSKAKASSCRTYMPTIRSMQERMSKVRINDLARELEVKSKAILDVLPKVGVTEKKTHSSSIEVDEAERVRKHFAGQAGASSARDGGSRTGETEIKTKIDLSHISKPGDVANLLRRKTEAPPPPPPPKPSRCRLLLFPRRLLQRLSRRRLQHC